MQRMLCCYYISYEFYLVGIIACEYHPFLFQNLSLDTRINPILLLFQQNPANGFLPLMNLDMFLSNTA